MVYQNNHDCLETNVWRKYALFFQYLFKAQLLPWNQVAPMRNFALRKPLQFQFVCLFVCFFVWKGNRQHATTMMSPIRQSVGLLNMENIMWDIFSSPFNNACLKLKQKLSKCCQCHSWNRFLVDYSHPWTLSYPIHFFM